MAKVSRELTADAALTKAIAHACGEPSHKFYAAAHKKSLISQVQHGICFSYGIRKVPERAKVKLLARCSVPFS
jgi:hypothetical protein